jgi:hypothetical protein
MNVFAILVPFRPDYMLSWVLLYIGPDVFLPLTSALAGLVGFLLMFWHRLAGLVLRMMGRGSAPTEEATSPASEAAADQSKVS